MKITPVRYIKNIICFCISGVVVLSVATAQPKVSYYFGTGFYNPDLKGLDPDSNNVLPDVSALGRNVLLNWGVRYQFYSNARIGYNQSHSFHNGTIDDSKFSRTITFRSISLETFYYPKENIELNFTLAPMFNKGSIKLTAQSTSSDWDALLNSYENTDVKLTTGGTMSKNWFGFSSQIGIRYYMTSIFSIEGKIGYYNSAYSEENWKLEKVEITGPKMNIKKLPVFNVHLVFGW
ncbi:MAG: hypothetical protein U9N31_09540 [Candidatus Marinimicrobia bacterium]|nr:hypothetical protein [Candidatus Neomarinimicrobiota bacterium]